MTTTTARDLLPLLADLTTEANSEPGSPTYRPAVYLTLVYRPHEVQRRVWTQLRGEYPFELTYEQKWDEVRLILNVQGINVHVSFRASVVGAPVQTLATEYTFDGDGDGAA